MFFPARKILKYVLVFFTVFVALVFFYKPTPVVNAAAYAGSGCNLRVGASPGGLFASSTKLFVVNGNGSFSVIDTDIGAVVNASTTNYMAASTTRAVYVGTKLFTNSGPVISIYETATSTNLLGTIHTGGDTISNMVATGTKVFVNKSGSSTVMVIETATTSLPYTSGEIAISAGTMQGSTVLGSKVYAVSSNHRVSIIETATTTPYFLEYIQYSVGILPRFITPVGSKLYVSNFTGSSVTVIDTVARTFTTNQCTVAPTVTVQSETSVASTSVSFNGSISVVGSANSLVRGFEYGTTTSYGQTASTTGNFATSSFSQTITGLQPSTLYYYRAYSINPVGLATSSGASFTTSAAIVPPVISSVASSTTQTTATITWTTDVNASSTVNYGTTTAYGSASTTDTLLTSHSIVLSGLLPSTLYNYQVGGANNSGLVSTSSNLTFTTAPLALPTVTVQSASSLTSTTGTLNGNITLTGGTNVTVRGFNYGLDTSYGSTASSTGIFGTGAFTQSISGLIPNTTYNYQAFAINSNGLATSSNQTFTTSAPGPYTASGCNIRAGLTPASGLASSTTLYLLGTNSEVAVIDTVLGIKTGTTTNTMGVGAAVPVYVGTKLFNPNGAVVNVYETVPSTTLIGNITVGGTIGGIVATGTKVFVSNQSLNNVAVIETATSGLPYISSTITLPGSSQAGSGVAFGSRIYFVGTHRVSAIETAGTTTPYLADTIAYSLGLIPRGIVPIGSKLYVLNYGGRDVTIIDPVARTWTNTQCADPTIPSAPLSFATTTPVGQTSQGLSWTAPFDGNRAISDYLIEYKQTSSPTWLTFPDGVSTATTTTVTGLSSGTSYDFRVTAVNVFGTSSPTNIISNGVKIPVQYLHVLSGGQSLSVGGGATYPQLSTVQPYNNVMLSPGVEGSVGPLIPLIENGVGEFADAETPSSGIANSLHAYDSLSRPVSVGLHGQGSSAYLTLKKGTSKYAKGITQATAVKNLVTAQGNTFKPVGVTIMHGENDYLNYYTGGVASTTYNYAGYLAEWQADYEADVNAITGATTTLPLFIDQVSSTASGEISVQQFQAHKNNPDKVILVGPKYQYALYGTHLNNVYSKYAGEMFAKVINKVSLLGETWNPLMPTGITRTGNIITVSYAIPYGTLAIDTTNVAQRPNYGFDFVQTGASATTTISSVQLINGNTQVQITLNNTPDGSSQKLRYAWTCNMALSLGSLGCDNKNNASSTGGNIRDTDSSVSPEIGSTGLPLYNFGVTFEESITALNSAPIISNVSAQASSTSALITWTTSTSSDSYVNYGVASTYGASSTLDVSLVTSHSRLLTSLRPCTIYKYRVGSKYLNSAIATSTGASFITLGCTGSSTVSSYTDSTVNTSGGGSLSLGKLTLVIPPSFTGTSSNANFQSKFLDKTAFIANAGLPPGVGKIIGTDVVNLSAIAGTSTVISTFDQPLTVTLEYSPSDVSDVNLSTLKIYRYDGSDWNPLSNCSVNTSSYTVSCSTQNFSDFALFGDSSSSSSSSSSSTTTSGERTAAAEIIYGCKDTNALNYNYFSASDPSLCKYATTTTKSITIVSKGNNFLKDLELGSRGSDIKLLQKYLNTNGFAVAKKGPGSIGNETTLFGPATKSALIKFQKAKGIKPSTGNLGPITRKYINSH